MVAGFIALLKVAVITAGLGQTKVEASGGVTEVMVGGVRGSPGFPALVPQHPVRTTANVNAKNAEIQILLTFNLRIRFSSSSLPSETAAQIHQFRCCWTGTARANRLQRFLHRFIALIDFDL
jgi:hypothetical protein